MNKTNNIKKIRDPIHNIIEVDGNALNIIDTVAFQRLRRIRQLGMGWMVYPAAEHSRFTHSVGTYHMSKRIMNNLEKNNPRFKLDKREKKLVTTAGLLHDIGHASLSNALETAIKNLNGKFVHEEMAIRIIKECEEISSVLEKHGDNFKKDVCEILINNYSNPHVASIVSSQFDADRIDYLLRDSYMTGADYGRFDIDWLLKNIQMGISTFPDTKGETVISINYDKGLNVLEQYLLGRYFMYTHVYFHKVIRGFETIITNIIRRILAKRYDDYIGFDYFSDLLSGEISVESFLKIDDFTLFTWFMIWYEKTDDQILKDLLYNLFSRKPFYKGIIPPDNRQKYAEEMNKILNRFDTEEECDYYFWVDSPENTAYKDLYIGDIFGEIFISYSSGDVVPLSSVEHSIINKAKDVLKKDDIVWYVKKE